MDRGFQLGENDDAIALLYLFGERPKLSGVVDDPRIAVLRVDLVELVPQFLLVWRMVRRLDPAAPTSL